MTRAAASHPRFYFDADNQLVTVNDQDPFDDMDQLAENLEEASENEDGAVVTDIEQYGRAQEIQKEQDDAIAPAVNIQPASVLTNGDPKLGDTATLFAGGPDQQVIYWPGKVHESRMVTIGVDPVVAFDGTFDVTRDPTHSAIHNYVRPYAKITWATRNAVHQATVDVGKGVQLSLTASAVYVSVGMDLPASGGATRMKVNGSLGFFAGRGTFPVTRTVYMSALQVGAGNKQSFTIPAFARQLLPIMKTELGAAIHIYIYDHGGNIIGELYGGDTVYSIMSGPLPLPDDAYSMTVQNVSEADSGPNETIEQLRFPFELAL